MRRPTAFALALLAVAGLAVVLDSGVLWIVVCLMLLAVVVEALGVGAALDLDPWTGAERRGEALRRMGGRGRPWDRTAPDHADEPPDLIWAREAERRRG